MRFSGKQKTARLGGVIGLAPSVQLNFHSPVLGEDMAFFYQK
jgi:hypothetical protein